MARLSSMFSVAIAKGVCSTGFSNAKPKKISHKNKKKKVTYKKVSENPPKYVKYIMGPEFYSTNEWRFTRAKVLDKYGYRCMCCGTSASIMQVDHIKPRSKYPFLELVFDNLQVLCKDCNAKKSNLYETDYRSKK